MINLLNKSHFVIYILLTCIFTTSYAQNFDYKKQYQQEESARADMLKHCLPARPIDYTNWLRGNKYKITHVYNYNIPNNFYVAYTDMTVVALHGANSINIIVPENVSVSIKSLGHINVYYMKDFKNIGGWIPVYLNAR